MDLCCFIWENTKNSHLDFKFSVYLCVCVWCHNVYVKLCHVNYIYFSRHMTIIFQAINLQPRMSWFEGGEVWNNKRKHEFPSLSFPTCLFLNNSFLKTSCRKYQMSENTWERNLRIWVIACPKNHFSLWKADCPKRFKGIQRDSSFHTCMVSVTVLTSCHLPLKQLIHLLFFPP